MLTTVRWTARGLGGLTALYFLYQLLRTGIPAPSLLTTGESVAVLGIAISFAGMFIVWMWEGAGGGLMVGGYMLAAATLSPMLSLRIFHVMAFSGALFVAAWWLGNKQGKPVRRKLPAGVTGWFFTWRKALAAGGGLLGLLFLNELFITPPLMSPGIEVDPAIAGRWEGRSAILSDWVRQHRLMVFVNIGVDGMVKGGVGDAELAGGRIAANRSWFGSVLGWRSEYIISGTLTGMVVAPESIARAEVRIPFNLRNARLVGCVLATGGGDDSRGALQCSRLSMFKPGPDRSVTFRIRAETVPEASRVYLTGDTDQLGAWNPAGVALDRQTDGTWARTFRFPEGMILYYNCTRGSWRTQALDATGGALPNRSIEVSKDTTITITVASWADIIM